MSFGWSLAELVEAAARCGAHEEAAAALERLGERTGAAGSDWALGVGARSRALLCDGSAADALYCEAIERLGRSRVAVHLPRAHLVYGEWLRRENRRHDAREQLRLAYEMLHRFGADAFAERARRELVATGESVSHRTTGPVSEALTAREAQIARLAADGKTNSEIGAELFLSHRTVEWHLHKVFTKLDVDSRSKLASAVARVAVGEPLNGIREIGGPEQFGLDDLVRRGLAATGDPRQVVTDEQARYSGVRLQERTLVPGPDAELGQITFADWLARQ